MSSVRPDVQPLDVSGAIYAFVGLGLAGFYMLLWYVAPGLMTAPVWSGSSIAWSMVLGTLALAIPVLLAWMCARRDVEDTSEAFEVAKH